MKSMRTSDRYSDLKQSLNNLKSKSRSSREKSSKTNLKISFLGLPLNTIRKFSLSMLILNSFYQQSNWTNMLLISFFRSLNQPSFNRSQSFTDLDSSLFRTNLLILSLKKRQSQRENSRESSCLLTQYISKLPSNLRITFDIWISGRLYLPVQDLGVKCLLI